MLVRIVTASNRGRSAPIGTPALMACTAASSMALPPSAWTFTSCTPLIAAAQSRNLFDGCRPGHGEELVADLEHSDEIGDLLRELHRRGQGIKIECDNQ